MSQPGCCEAIWRLVGAGIARDPPTPQTLAAASLFYLFCLFCLLFAHCPLSTVCVLLLDTADLGVWSPGLGQSTHILFMYLRSP